LIVAVPILATLLLASGRYGWLAGATAVVLATPRFFVYDVTYLLVALPNRARRRPISATTVA
jgi:hypothetical protein